MRRLLFAVPALLIALHVLPSCGSSSGDGAPATPDGTGGTAAIPTCTVGERCACANQLVGTTTCDGFRSVCDCSACPAYDPGTAPSLTACGGDPTGTWRTVSAQLGGATIAITQGGATVRSCGYAVDSGEPIVDLRFELDAGGKDALFLDRLPRKISLVESCAAGSDGCGALSAASMTCAEGSCGLCSCALAAVGAQGSGTWSQTATSLTMGADGSTLTGDFCVSGNSMQFRTNPHEVVTLERVTAAGVPVPCSMRTMSTCEVAGGGCYVGVCSGGPTCENINEQACASKMGCSFDPTACGGTAPTTCGLGDYDKTPGCVFTPAG